MSSKASGWQGRLELEFARQNGTQLIHSAVQAPLKVQRSFYPEGAEVCHSVILHTAGGVVGGDRLALDITLHPQSHALITTAAAAKIYRSPDRQAYQTLQIRVTAGACLEWLPQETIVFDGANYQQEMHIDLAAGATWIGWEMTRLGRTARSEQFLNGEWRSTTQIWQQNRLLWIDPQRLQGGLEMTSLHGLAGFPVVASFAAIGRPVSIELVEKARHLWLSGNYAGEAGVTRLMSGLLCRYRGCSTQAARQWFIEVWNLMRLEWCDRPACKPRVWQ